MNKKNMNLKFVKLKLVFFALVLITSCQVKTNSSSETSVGSLFGQWGPRNNCVYVGSSTYMKETLTFNRDLTFINTYESFKDSGCYFSPVVTQKIYGTFNVVPTNSSETNGTMDSVIQTWVIVPTSSAAASSYNSLNYCGFNNWALNVEKNVTGLNCGTTTMPSAGTTEYSVYKVETSYIPGFAPYFDAVFPGDLSFGTKGSTTNDGTTPEKRHTVYGSAYNKY